MRMMLWLQPTWNTLLIYLDPSKLFVSRGSQNHVEREGDPDSPRHPVLARHAMRACEETMEAIFLLAVTLFPISIRSDAVSGTGAPRNSDNARYSSLSLPLRAFSLSMYSLYLFLRTLMEIYLMFELCYL